MKTIEWYIELQMKFIHRLPGNNNHPFMARGAYHVKLHDEEFAWETSQASLAPGEGKELWTWSHKSQ